MKFLAPDPWPHITATLKRASRRLAITAYLGSGAADLLPLRKGDTLVVNASDAAVRHGSTDPKELAKFVKRGVRCYSVDGLHAKIYVADDEVMIGSANASANSKERLLESCLSLEEPDIADEVEEWVTSLRLPPVDIAEIKRLIPLIPKRRSWSGEGTSRKRIEARMWVTWVGALDPDEGTTGFEEWVKAAAATASGDAEPFTVSETRKKASRLFRNVQPGDEVIVVDHTEKPKTVWAPMRVLGKVYKEKQGAKVIRFIALEDFDEPGISLAALKAFFKKAGRPLRASAKVDREITSSREASELRRFWHNRR